MNATWNRDRIALEREVCRPLYTPMLAELQHRASEVAQLSSWPAVAAFAQELGVRGPDADVILRPLVEMHRAAADNRASTVLLLICMPELAGIHRAHRRWMPGTRRRWQLVCECFVRSLARLDPALRPQRLGQKLLNDTARGFYDECAREWARSARFETVDPDDLAAFVGAEDPAFEDFEQRHMRDRAARRVRSATAAGAICRRDSLLVLGTRIYGFGLRGAAELLGIGYEAAKKRRQRAEARLRGRKS